MPGAIIFATRRSRPRFWRSARTALRDARVLDLDRHAAPVVQPRAVDLADRGGGERLRLELLEHLLERLARGRPRSPCASPRRRRAARSRAAPRAWPRGARGPPAAALRCRRTTRPGRSSSPRPSSARARRASRSAACSWRRSAAARRPLLGARQVGRRRRVGSAPPGRPPARRASRCAAAGRSGSSSRRAPSALTVAGEPPAPDQFPWAGSFRRFSATALSATITLEPDIEIAPTSGRSTKPDRLEARRRRSAAQASCSRPPRRGSGASCARFRG